jgi:4-amino-4-deoxy-L-arabinose transferase-like glycosyltransferase
LRAWAAFIVALAVIAAAAAGWRNSATNDEPYHLLAAHSYVEEGVGDLNPEHPPLVKLVAGAALAPLGLRGTAAPPVARLLRLSEEVRAFLYANSRRPATILLAGRLAVLLVFLPALLWGTWRWARELGGPRAALVALVAVSAQPLVLGHAFVVHTDVPEAAAWIWALYFLHALLRGRPRAWPGLGAALGAALLVKFSAVFLVAIVVVAVLARMRRPGGGPVATRAAAAVALAGCLLVAGYAVALRNTSAAVERATIARHLGLWPGTAPLSHALQRLAGVSRPLAHFGLGLAYVAETSSHAQGINVFLGKLSPYGFFWYFPVAFALKTTAPFLALAVIGVLAGVRRRDAPDQLLLFAVGLYLVVSLGTSYNIGARYLLPIVAPLAILAGRAVATWSARGRGLAIGLLGVAAAVPFPHYIAHFTALIGGARNGAAFLNDSNLDWGQDWRRAATTVARLRRAGEAVTYVYLGAGFPAYYIPASRNFLDAETAAPSGLVMVSSYAKVAGAAYLDALGERRTAADLRRYLQEVTGSGEVLADVGHTIRIYRLPPTQ